MIVTLNVWASGMGKPLKIERIDDMFQLLWLESVITEASLMTRNIKLPSVFMNWMCFHCRSGGALPPSHILRGLGGSASQPKPKKIEHIWKHFEKQYE